MKALILCDIDGCLNAGKLHPLDLETLGKIKSKKSELEKQGIGFTLCTGRPQPYAEAIGTILDVTLPMICENGSMLFYPATDAVHYLVANDALADIAKARQIILDLPWLGKGSFIEPGKELSFSIVGPEISKKDENELDVFTEKVANSLSAFSLYLTHSNSSIDITVANVNKGSAISPLVKELENMGHMQIKLFGIGDSAGDISFLTKMDLVLAPSNCAGSVGEIAHHIAKNSHAAGTLQLLDVIEKKIG